MENLTQHLLSRLELDLGHFNIYEYKGVEQIFASANLQKIKTQQQWMYGWLMGLVWESRFQL